MKRSDGNGARWHLAGGSPLRPARTSGPRQCCHRAGARSFRSSSHASCRRVLVTCSCAAESRGSGRPLNRMRVRSLGANLAGQLVYPVVGLLMVPFYVERLGLDAFGLIGLMALVVSLLGVFSRGLGGALQRELSQ